MKFASLLCLLSFSLPILAQDLFIQGEFIFTGTGTPLSPGYLRIQGERIVEVLQGKPPQGTKVEASAKMIFPGFMDAHCFLGLSGNLEENVLAMTPQLRAEDGYDPYDPKLLKNLEQGLTSFILAPGDGNLLSGQMALIAPHSPQNYLLRSKIGLKSSFSRQALLSYRNPTSLMGAMWELQNYLKKSPLTLDLFLCDHPTQVSLALQWIRQQQGKGILALKEGAYFKELPAFLKTQHYQNFLILQAPGWNSDRLALQMPSKLHQAGFRFALASYASTTVATALRIGANLSIHYGLDPDIALKAITLHPALLFQAEKETGTLQPGAFANVILADDHPLNLATRFQMVLVKGKKIVPPTPKF